MKKIRQLAGQTVVYGMGTMVPRLLNYLLLTPFYTRVFERNEYGMFSELYSYTALLLVLMTYGMETAFFRFAVSEKNPDKVYGTALLSLLTTSSLFVIAMLVFLGPVSNVIQYGKHQDYVFYLTMIIAFDSVTAISFAKLRYHNQALKFTIIKITNIAVTIGTVIFFLWFCPMMLHKYPGSIISKIYSPEIGVGYAFIANLAGCTVQLLLLLPDMFTVKIKFDRKLLFRMLLYSLPLVIVGLGGAINENADKILLKYLLPGKAPLAQVGIYAASYKVAVLMLIFVQMFRYAAEPFYFVNAKDQESSELFADVMKYFVIFGLFIFLGVMLFMDVIKYFIGADFRSGLQIVPIILISYLFFGVISNLSIWYKLENKTLYGAFITVIGAAITLAVNFTLIPAMGYMASAWATLACYAGMMLLSYFWGQRHFRVNYDVKKMVIYFVIALGIYFVSEKVISGSGKFLINLILFAAFVGVVSFREKVGDILKIKPKSSS
ncbi:MAG: lipopolysaccharide biosynthesis protein [Victivallaceae bacterium]